MTRPSGPLVRSLCSCPHIDDYRINSRACPVPGHQPPTDRADVARALFDQVLASEIRKDGGR